MERGKHNVKTSAGGSEKKVTCSLRRGTHTLFKRLPSSEAHDPHHHHHHLDLSCWCLRQVQLLGSWSKSSTEYKWLLSVTLDKSPCADQNGSSLITTVYLPFSCSLFPSPSLSPSPLPPTETETERERGERHPQHYFTACQVSLSQEGESKALHPASCSR